MTHKLRKYQTHMPLFNDLHIILKLRCDTVFNLCVFCYLVNAIYLVQQFCRIRTIINSSMTKYVKDVSIKMEIHSFTTM